MRSMPQSSAVSSRVRPVPWVRRLMVSQSGGVVPLRCVSRLAERYMTARMSANTWTPAASRSAS